MPRYFEGTNDANKISERLSVSENILSKIETDTTVLLKEMAKPIIYWTKIKDNSDNVALLKTLSTEFLAQELVPSKFYANKSGRYGLLIHNIINQSSELKPLASKMLTAIKENLRINQIIAFDSLSRDELDKRAWYRYLYAYVSDYEVSITNDTLQKQNLLKNAFDFSPDLTDKNHQSAYFYDMYFLNGRESFEEEYLTFLTKNSADKKQVIETLLKMALKEPNYKEKLASYYTQNTTTDVTFLDFWTASIEHNAKQSPKISVVQIDKKVFSSEAQSGRWVLIDFWGTWCGPCREEHPDLQKFYDQVIVTNPSKIQLLTIACRDTEAAVVKYMEKNGYTFPVGMSDGNYETNFNVQGYPTKILITPKGRLIVVPFNIDWINFVKKYANL